MPYVNLDGLKVYYEEYGAGDPPILFIHGWTANLDRWRAMINKFSKYKRVIALDLPGHRKSDKPRINYTIETYKNHILKFMDELKIEKAIVAGHSMGGMIAQKLAIENPERVLALILIGTSAKVIDSFGMLLNTLLARFLLKIMYPTAFRIILGKAFSKYFPKDEKKRLIEQWLKENDKYVVRNSFKNFVKYFDTRSELQKIKAPTLIIVGELDAMLPPRMSKLLHEKIADSKFVLIEKGGHEIMLEKPNEVNDAIERFLKEKGFI